MNDSFRSSQEMIRLQSQDAKKLANQENRLKRLVDMNHQVQSLLVKRDHLRNELQAIENYLTSLDLQIKSQETYVQLTLK